MKYKFVKLIENLNKLNMNLINIKVLKILVLLMFFVSIYSCDKDGELTIVNGKIYDFYSDQPVNGYKIVLTEQKDFSFLSPESVIDTFTTNEKGEFEFNFENEKGFHNVLYYVGNETYASLEKTLLLRDKKNDIEIRVKPFNTLIINLLKISDTYDNIRIVDETQRSTIYDSIYSNSNIVYSKSIPEEYLNLSFRLYNEKSWENYEYSDTTIYINMVENEEFQFKY